MEPHVFWSLEIREDDGSAQVKVENSMGFLTPRLAPVDGSSTSVSDRYSLHL